MNTAFYQWFLAELLAALRELELSDDVRDADMSAPSGTTPILNTPFGPVTTRQQSISGLRPRQAALLARVNGRDVLLGDGKRFTAPPLTAPPASVVFTRPAYTGWLPPWPVMPPQAAPTSIAWDGPQHAAIAFQVAADNLWDSGFDREAATGWCPALADGVTPVELSGVFATPNQRRCLADNKARPEHLATGDRPNMRLPVAQGIDATGPYLRVVNINTKTYEFREEAP